MLQQSRRPESTVRTSLAMLLLALSWPSAATPPLLPAADVADVGMQAWWREGDLVVGMPQAPGRPGLRPLQGLEPIVLPQDLDRWASVGESCVTRPESRARIGGQRLTARITASAEGPVVQLVVGKEVVAANALGRPALVCEVLLAEADSVPGPEVVVAWRLELGPVDAASELRGITVYRVPEALL